MTKFTPVTGPVQLAFLGCGVIAGNHAKALKAFPDVNLYFASRQAEKAKAFSEKHKGKGWFESYEAAIAAPEINTVFIATPPDSHLALAVAALRAGKHVMVEKPPFFTSADFDAVDVLRREKGLQVFVTENYFYKPLLQKLRGVLASGEIGDIKFLYFNAARKQTVTDWRGDKALAGGGALFEGGIHWINFISNLGLTVKSVRGFQPGGRRESREIERSIQVVAEYAEGPVGTLLYSWEVNTLLKGLRLSRIYGTEGSVTFESNGLFIFQRGRRWRLLFPGLKNIGGVQPMFSDFFAALRSGRQAAFSFEKARRDVELIEQAYATALG